MFMHHIYEFQKGVRSLVLCTMETVCAEIVAERLKKRDIEYLIQPVSEKKVNLYFGKPACLEVVGSFIDRPMHKFTPEEDFILGAMLGYNIEMQCERLCSRKKVKFT